MEGFWNRSHLALGIKPPNIILTFQLAIGSSQFILADFSMWAKGLVIEFLIRLARVSESGLSPPFGFRAQNLSNPLRW